MELSSHNLDKPKKLPFFKYFFPQKMLLYFGMTADDIVKNKFLYPSMTGGKV